MSSKKIAKKVFFLDVLSRLKEIRGYKREKEIANALKIKQNTLSTYKSRNTIPYELLIAYCEENRINIRWLLFGEGDPYISGDEKKRKKKEHPPIYNEGAEKKGGDHEATWDRMGFSQAVEMLHQIYASGNKKLIRAINANLDSFSEAVTLEKKVADLQQRLERLEKIIKDLESREDCCVSDGIGHGVEQGK